MGKVESEDSKPVTHKAGDFKTGDIKIGDKIADESGDLISEDDDHTYVTINRGYAMISKNPKVSIVTIVREVLGTESRMNIDMDSLKEIVKSRL